MKVTLTTLAIAHANGINVYVHQSKEAAQSELDAYCKEWWRDVPEQPPMPADPEERVSLYFAEVEGECAEIEEHKLEIEEPCAPRRRSTTPSIDLKRFVQWEPAAPGTWVQVSGIGRRGQEVGEIVGVIRLKHDNGYEVVVRFTDGKIDSFPAMGLFPASAPVQPEENRDNSNSTGES